MFSSSRCLLGVLACLLACTAPSGFAQDTPADDEPAPPWELTRIEAGEPQWAPLLKLRALEAEYRDTRYWGSYLQIRAQQESAMGNHLAALALWDSLSAPPDSVGTLPEGIRAVDALEYLSNAAESTRAIMVNERHHAGSDRLLTFRLLSTLKEKGYRYFAAETFNVADSELSTRGYPTMKTGSYVGEAVFAELVREALRLGYVLVPYEMTDEQSSADSDRSPQQRRDFAQAQNLQDRIFAQDADARVLVHAGYSHILEEKSERWYPMALYFRELTGIDPLTVDQTRLSERAAPEYEHPAYRAALAAGLLESEPILLVDSENRPFSPASFAVDLQLLTPPTTMWNGRPEWMDFGGRRVAVEMEVPECEESWCVVEARGRDLPEEALPLDWTEADGVDSAWLFLPPEEPVTVFLYDENGALLRSSDLVASAESRGGM